MASTSSGKTLFQDSPGIACFLCYEVCSTILHKIGARFVIQW